MNENEAKEEGSIGQRRALPGKYLTFRLGTEDYGFEILKVQEIMGLINVSRVPRMPSHVRGIINLRGKLIPVIEMREKFGMAALADTARTCIIVVQVVVANTRVTMGVIVDNVSEVLNIQSNQLEAPPNFGKEIDTEFMLGMGKVGQKVVILLDIDRVLTEMGAQQIMGALDEEQVEKGEVKSA